MGDDGNRSLMRDFRLSPLQVWHFSLRSMVFHPAKYGISPLQVWHWNRFLRHIRALTFGFVRVQCFETSTPGAAGTPTGRMRKIRIKMLLKVSLCTDFCRCPIILKKIPQDYMFVLTEDEILCLRLKFSPTKLSSKMGDRDDRSPTS